MWQKEDLVFRGLSIVAWIIFVGLSIEAGGLIVNFIVHLYNPSWLPNLYQKSDLGEMYQRSKSAFFSMYSFILVIAILKAFLFYLLIRLVATLNLTRPFNELVAKQILQISYYTLCIGGLSYLARHSASNLRHRGFEVENLNTFWADSQAFILMAAVIYVIALIFKRGISLQNENDLTV